MQGVDQAAVFAASGQTSEHWTPETGMGTLMAEVEPDISSTHPRWLSGMIQKHS
jgi:hypothetical protein